MGGCLGDATDQSASVAFALLVNKATTLLDQIKNLAVDGVDRFLNFCVCGLGRVFHEIDLYERVGKEPSEQSA